jgi:CHAT domain-containing protein
MRLSTTRLTALLTLVATLTISDFPLIRNLKFNIHTYQALAQTASSLETQAQTFGNLQQSLVVQNKPNAALEIAERARARAFVELLQRRLSPNSQEQVTITPPTIEQIKQTAREQKATLVEYSIIYDEFQVTGKQQTKQSELFIWVVQPSGEVSLRRVDLKPLWQKQNTTLSDLVASTRNSIGLNPGSTTSNVEKSQNQGLQQLYQLLIQPIADLLPTDPNARVVFIPQASLFLVPFAALQDASGNYLIEQHSILTAPSIQVLQLTRQQRQRLGNGEGGMASGEFLVVGNPTMPSVPPKPGERPQQFINLPGAEQEAKAIAPLLNTQALTGKEATKAAILQRMPRARIIHLATNAIADQERGMGSAIALAPSGNDNGLLTAEEILDLKLNAELVVLSGCNTGLGRITGDGVIGLGRSFIAAGVPSVIVSLGYVSDEATAFLMTEFYRNLSSTPDKAQALRSAMLTTMKKYPNPLDWGAFTLIGEAQ